MLIAALVLLVGCGVKNNLVKPNGQPNSKTERAPSLPPSQTGR